jgi:hypothetical protein
MVVIAALLLASCTSNQPPSTIREMRAPVPAAPAGEAVEVVVTVNHHEISEVRLYFKPMKATSYIYLEMTPSGEDRFTAHLPPARYDAKGLDYLLLFHNGRGESRKTKPFRLLIQKNYRAVLLPAGEPTGVYVESAAPPEFDTAFAVPLKILASPKPLLAEAEEDPYPSITPEKSTIPPLAPFSGLGGFSFSIKVGGFGLFYGGR